MTNLKTSPATDLICFCLCTAVFNLFFWGGAFKKLIQHPSHHISEWLKWMYVQYVRSWMSTLYLVFFSPFLLFPPGRLSPIISTLHVCKAGAPWGILCPLHPLLCWGLCSSWHLAPPVEPLCRCLYSQLSCPCPRPLLQPVCQPALYSRYNFTHKALYQDRNFQPSSLWAFDFFQLVNSVYVILQFSNTNQIKTTASHIAKPSIPSCFVALLLSI